MTYGLTINGDSPIWIKDASFCVISLVAGREQSVASLSVGGRHVMGMSKTWASKRLTVGDHLSILRQAHPPLRECCPTPATSIPKSVNRRISGFALNVEGENATVVEISRHDLVQAVVTWDAASDVFKVSLDALTSNDEGLIDDSEGFLLEQPSETFRPIHLQIV